MSDRHRFRVWNPHTKTYMPTDNRRWISLSHDGIVYHGYDDTVEEPIAGLEIEFCTGLSASKSYRGDKPEDLLVWEGDVLKFLNNATHNIGTVFTGVVVFDDCNFCIRKIKEPTCKIWNFWLGSPHMQNIEIIGTTHEVVK